MFQLLAGMFLACALYLKLSGHQRSPHQILASHDLPTVPITLLLEMVAVCIRQGSSIPHALEQIALASANTVSEPLYQIASLLNQGNDWHTAWSQAYSHKLYGRHFTIVGECLESSWRQGISPLGRIETTIEQINRSQKRRLEEASARLTVKLLLPTALCILPAFILIGVMPCIASFASGLSL